MSVLNQCLASTSGQQQLPRDPHCASVSAKGKRKMMCEPERDVSLLVTPPQPQSVPQFHPHTPEISSRYSPKLARRMQTDTCFKCKKKGHWMVDCPLNSPDADYPKIHCRCGHGFCEVKTATNNRNKGRKYYACPIQRGKKCKSFVRWCDDPVNESDLHPPPYKYPECTKCGAGVCRKETAMSSPNVGRCYFSCPVGENFGSCGFILWEDTLLSSTSIVPAQRSIQKTLHYYFEGCQINTTNNNDMEEGSDIQLEYSKRMRIMDDSQCPPIIGSSDLPEREDTAQKAALMERGEQDETAALSFPVNHVAFPDFEVPNYLQDLCMPCSKSWDSIVEEARHLVMIYCRQREFERQFSAAASSFGISVADPCFMGWLGRLLFFHPTKSLKFPSPQPFYCCVFPSFDAIIIPKQKSIRDSLSGESNHLVISNRGQHVQLPTEVSRDEVGFNRSLGRERKLMSKVERQRKMALIAQQQLLDDLETLNPLDHESMREAAEATFDVLDPLSVDYKCFSEHVWEFINHASSLAEIQKSIEKFLSPEEHMQRYEEEKVRLDSIRDNYVKTKASFELCWQRSKSLCEEASRLKAMLHHVESQLICCESETLKIETNLDNINTGMLEAERSLQVAAEQAQAARKLGEERQVKESAAKAALDKAKLELGK